METRHLKAAVILTGIISLVAIVSAFYTQWRAEQTLTPKCSYLDPILVDLLAFSAGLFLVLEGLYRIIEHQEIKTTKDRLFLAIRIAFGCAIITLHVMQFIHK
ncbi:MAG: hypothetical protein AAB420_00170 [Patescibacteria group bacterium]